MTFFNAKLEEVVKKHPRYAYEAYEFMFQALNFTQKMLGREPPEEVAEAGAAGPQHHVSGQELLEGIRVLALREFGFLARTVFHSWGIDRTDDFGEIVFNLVEAELMSKTNEDNREDFRGVYHLDEALVQGYRIQLDEAR
ncbi:MAG TPA: Minf_1886 family protein [Gemmataceae bacterium]|nr:Minf_1886 family protein [Gemmataceae bacterium]